MAMNRTQPSPALPSLDRPSDVAARVAGILRVVIVRGDVARRERLVPERIADELGVSRPPVMAAIRQLEREGLVSLGSNGRPYVTGLTTKYVTDLYRFRLLLDEAVVATVLGRVPREAEAHLRSITAEMAVHAAGSVLEAFADCDLAFHTAFLALADNQFLLGAWQAMSDVAYALLTVTDRLFSILPQLASSHQVILDSLCAEDEAAALAALQQHYEVGERLLAIPILGTTSQSSQGTEESPAIPRRQTAIPSGGRTGTRSRTRSGADRL